MSRKEKKFCGAEGNSQWVDVPTEFALQLFNPLLIEIYWLGHLFCLSSHHLDVSECEVEITVRRMCCWVQLLQYVKHSLTGSVSHWRPVGQEDAFQTALQTDGRRHLHLISGHIPTTFIYCIQPSVAVSTNFINKSSLCAVASFLESRPCPFRHQLWAHLHICCPFYVYLLITFGPLWAQSEQCFPNETECVRLNVLNRGQDRLSAVQTHKSCVITGFHLPWGPTATPLILHSSSLPLSYPCYSLLAGVLCLFFYKPHLCSSFLLCSTSLFPMSFPSFMSVSSSLLDRLLSEMAAGSSVAQLGINKRLDISLLSPSPVALFFPSSPSSPRGRHKRFFLHCTHGDPEHLSIRQQERKIKSDN